jgi:short subunit dehydrogenase-like uncharacterized protein
MGLITWIGMSYVVYCNDSFTDGLRSTGEIAWYRDMLDKYEADAKASGAIVSV